MKVACVIPAWNEAAHISEVILGVKPRVDSVIVVDDGSRDQTAILAKAAGAMVVRHKINRGQGAALQTGNDLARIEFGADIIVHFDADRQFLPEEIAEVIEPIRSGQADIVFGSRFLGKKTNLPTFKKRIIMPLARLTNRLLFGISLSDPQNGFRAMNRLAAEKIRIENRGMAHNSEIQAKAFKYKLRIQEVPVTVIYHRFGQSLGGGFKIISDLILSKFIK